MAVIFWFAIVLVVAISGLRIPEFQELAKTFLTLMALAVVGAMFLFWKGRVRLNREEEVGLQKGPEVFSGHGHN